MLKTLLLLTGVAAAMSTKPVFDYTFGANCPFCKEFGSTLKQLYQSGGIAMNVDFQMEAAIRMCNGAYECPDEDKNCPGTKWALCALDAAPDSHPIAQQISFISCWDEQQGEDWESHARQCASAGMMDFKNISACANGDRGADLQKASAATFAKKFPSHTDCSGIFGVPSIQINGELQDDRTFKSLLSKLCATGISAEACKGNVVVV